MRPWRSLLTATLAPALLLIAASSSTPALAFEPGPAGPPARAAPLERGNGLLGLDLEPEDCAGAARLHQAMGGLIGGVVGGLIGSGVGRGSGRVAATGAGTLIGVLGGAVLGGKVAEGSPQCLPEAETRADGLF